MKKPVMKEPFNINEMLKRIRQAVKPFPKAMLFELRDRGFNSVFQQMVACMISVRTLDEVSLKVSLRLFEKAKNASEMARLNVEEISNLIKPATFYFQKAKRLSDISKTVAEKYQDELPCDEEVLLNLPGIGPKCAHLILGIACKAAKVGVDVHVHRVTNRWGYVQSSSPQKTENQLMEKLPKKYWVTINELLVPFGKHLCTGKRPKCSICPVLEYCQQVGVENPR